MSLDINSQRDYDDFVEFNAECIIDELAQEPDPPTPMDITEAVEQAAGAKVIWNTSNLAILRRSRNQPEEWTHRVSDGDSWQDVVRAMAYDVLCQDLYEELDRRDLV